MARDGTAVIRASDRVGQRGGGPEDGEPWPWEVALNHFGHHKYDFTLEVRVPGQEPFSVTDRFKVPRKAENLGFLDSGRKIPVGVELPIRMDRPGRIEIDHGRMDPADAEAARATLGEA